MPPQNFWWITSEATHSDDPYGVGGSALYWLVKIKQQALKAWLNYSETLALPTVVAVHAPNASTQEQDQLLAAADAIASGARSARISDESRLILLEATRSGSTDYPTLIGIMDAAIAKVILSQTMTTDDGSSLAQGRVHKDVRDEIVEADAALIDDSFNRQVIAPWCFWNFGPDVRPPRVQRRLEEETDLKALAEVDKTLADIGWVRSPESFEDVFGDGYVYQGGSAPSAENGESTAVGQESDDSPQNDGDTPEFAEGSPAQLAIDLVTEQLADRAGPLVQQWVDQIKGRLLAADDLPTFAEGLYGMFPDMPSEAFVGLMEQAFAVSRAGGVYDAATEAE